MYIIQRLSQNFLNGSFLYSGPIQLIQKYLNMYLCIDKNLCRDKLPNFWTLLLTNSTQSLPLFCRPFTGDVHTSTPITEWLCPRRKHDDVIKWKHFPRYWPFVWGIHRSPVNSPHKVQWRGGLMFSLICVWINGWVNNREAGDLRRYRAHYDVTLMVIGDKRQFLLDCKIYGQDCDRM